MSIFKISIEGKEMPNNKRQIDLLKKEVKSNLLQLNSIILGLGNESVAKLRSKHVVIAVTNIITTVTAITALLDDKDFTNQIINDIENFFKPKDWIKYLLDNNFISKNIAIEIIQVIDFGIDMLK